jgi:SEC-C motif/gag-polyprotein putative aspartyl protease
MSQLQTKSFTLEANGILRVLQTDVWMAQVADPKAAGPGNFKKYTAIWDTGATNTVLTQKVVDECGLKPIGMTVAHGVQGQHTTEVYLVSVGLPNGVAFRSVRVTKGNLGGAVDVLIGMDMITRGDFAITHHNGNTCFTFRYPSMEKIDFNSKPPPPPVPVHAPPKVGRNDPCPCKSGKKYKHCCLDKPPAQPGPAPATS